MLKLCGSVLLNLPGAFACQQQPPDVADVVCEPEHELVVRAWDICPSLDPVHLAEPSWLSHTRADPNARLYVGGKFEGTLVTMDVDALLISFVTSVTSFGPSARAVRNPAT